MKRITISAEQLPQIARFEMTFKDILGEIPIDEVEFDFEGQYQIALTDLEQALRNMQKKNSTIGEVYLYWADIIESRSEIDDVFGLDTVRERDEKEMDTPYDYRGLLASKETFFCRIWCEFEWEWYMNDDDALVADVIDIEKRLLDFEHYYFNLGKSIDECVFSDEEKEAYIRKFSDADELATATEKEVELCRKFTDELCEFERLYALHLKGYACYGGNRLYACDWEASRDCMLQLLDKTDDPGYANTLGYIYYYGRCTGGLPEYEKAFYYFGISAVNGLYEGMYKLADMYYHGYACKKSPATAKRLYEMVYDDCLKNYFLKGEDSTFADAALRMGNVYANGIDTDIDVEKAYYYYLQANYAAILRAENSTFYGDVTVVKNAQKAIEEIKTKLPYDYFEEYQDCIYPQYFSEAMAENNRCELRKYPLPNGEWELELSRIATQSVPEPEKVLVTIPEIQFCQLLEGMRVTTVGTSSVYFQNDADVVRCDYYEWNAEEERYEFYYDGEITALIACANLRIKKPIE